MNSYQRLACMAHSGIPWIDATFDWCVRLLVHVAKLLGITYEEINVYLFVFALPLVLAISLIANAVLLIALARSKGGR